MVRRPSSCEVRRLSLRRPPPGHSNEHGARDSNAALAGVPDPDPNRSPSLCRSITHSPPPTRNSRRQAPVQSVRRGREGTELRPGIPDPYSTDRAQVKRMGSSRGTYKNCVPSMRDADRRGLLLNLILLLSAIIITVARTRFPPHSLRRSAAKRKGVRDSPGSRVAVRLFPEPVAVRGVTPPAPARPHSRCATCQDPPPKVAAVLARLYTTGDALRIIATPTRTNHSFICSTSRSVGAAGCPPSAMFETRRRDDERQAPGLAISPIT